MKAAHVMLAVLVAAIWGFAFVATKLGLDSFSPPQLTAIRFLIAALPVFVLPSCSVERERPSSTRRKSSFHARPSGSQAAPKPSAIATTRAFSL